jgi:hypothetical protein
MTVRRFNDLVEQYGLSFEFAQAVFNQAAMRGLDHEDYVSVAGDVMESLGAPKQFQGGYTEWRKRFNFQMKAYRESGESPVLKRSQESGVRSQNDWKNSTDTS